jgi:chromosome segregation ATPase
MGITLDRAYDVIRELQSKLDRCTRLKIQAQAELFELMHSDKPLPENYDIKADNTYLREELKRVIAQRDDARSKHDAALQRIKHLRREIDELQRGGEDGREDSTKD